MSRRLVNDQHNAAPFSTAGRFIFEVLELGPTSGRMLSEDIPSDSNQDMQLRYCPAFPNNYSLSFDVVGILIDVELGGSCRTIKTGPCPLISRHLTSCRYKPHTGRSCLCFPIRFIRHVKDRMLIPREHQPPNSQKTTKVMQHEHVLFLLQVACTLAVGLI